MSTDDDVEHAEPIADSKSDGDHNRPLHARKGAQKSARRKVKRLTDTLTALELAIETRKRVEVLQQQVLLQAAEQKKEEKPNWWQDRRAITSLAALIAAMVPAAVAVQTYIAKERDIALAQQAQEAKVRLDYLDRANDPKSSERVLRYIRDTSNEGPLKKWAENELAAVQQRIDELEKARADAEKARDEALENERVATDELQKATATINATDAAKVQELEGKAARASAEAEKQQARIKELEERLTGTTVRDSAPPAAKRPVGFSRPRETTEIVSKQSGYCAPGSVQVLAGENSVPNGAECKATAPKASFMGVQGQAHTWAVRPELRCKCMFRAQ